VAGKAIPGFALLHAFSDGRQRVCDVKGRGLEWFGEDHSAKEDCGVVVELSRAEVQC